MSEVRQETCLVHRPKTLNDEQFEALVESKDVRIERIVSFGQASPPGFWYDQSEAEWVLLLRGAAGLEFEGDTNIVHLQPGDSLNIPPHVRHRVAWTAENEATIWLAVFYQG